MAISGYRALVILQALANRDLTALEIIEVVSKATNKRVRLRQSGIYTQLERLERAGLVRGHYSDAKPAERGGRRRRYYRLQAAGRRLLNDLAAVQAQGLESA